MQRFTFDEFLNEFKFTPSSTPHKPKMVNVSREMKVMQSTGEAAGSTIQGQSVLMHTMTPIVEKAFRTYLRQGFHPQDIEEMLLDSLRLSILYTNEKGDMSGGIKTSMSSTEFIRKTQSKRRDQEANLGARADFNKQTEKPEDTTNNAMSNTSPPHP